MRDRFVDELLRAGRADAPQAGARERALRRLGVASAPAGVARALSGMALVAMVGLVLAWGPPAAASASRAVDQAGRCTAGIEAPPCVDAGGRVIGGGSAAAAPTGSSGSGGSLGPSGG